MANDFIHICLADDDPDDHYFFEMALKEINSEFRLSKFVHGQELAHYLKTTDRLPNLVILDMNMPGNNGLQCLITMKHDARLRHIPVAILSTACSPYIIEQAYKAGACTCVQKPNSVKELKEVIGNLLDACISNKQST